MSLTVRELTEIPYLRTRFMAGEGGAERTITWAHSCEMPRPWEWLEKGDLLMSSGMGIPHDPEGQVAFVESLAAVQVSGIAIGEDMHAPAISPAMIKAAEQQAMPLLITAFEVPFIQVSRAVVGANQGSEHLRLVKTMRVYDSVRSAMERTSDPAALFRELGDEIACDLFVCTDRTGDVAFPGSQIPSPPILDAFFGDRAARGEGVGSRLRRLNVDDRVVLVVPVPARRPVSLIVVPRGSDTPSYAILQHVSTIAALEFERVIAAREELRRRASETLAGLLDRRLPPDSAYPEVYRHELGDEPMVIAVTAPEPAAAGSLHHALAERAIPHMLLHRSPLLYCLLPARDSVLSKAIAVFDEEELRVGISDRFVDLGAVATAVREGRWALDVATAEGRSLSNYSEKSKPFGARSLSEAQITVDRLLGEILEYDREHGADLVPSLVVFLRQNRSWKKAAAELHIHKQTLVYRMHRIEELTGRKLTDSSTIAEFWIAVSALEMLE